MQFAGESGQAMKVGKVRQFVIAIGIVMGLSLAIGGAVNHLGPVIGVGFAFFGWWLMELIRLAARR